MAVVIAVSMAVALAVVAGPEPVRADEITAGDPALGQVCSEEGRKNVEDRLGRAIERGGLDPDQAAALREHLAAGCGEMEEVEPARIEPGLEDRVGDLVGRLRRDVNRWWETGSSVAEAGGVSRTQISEMGARMARMFLLNAQAVEAWKRLVSEPAGYLPPQPPPGGPVRYY